MSMTGLDVFDTTLQKTHRWLNELMDVLGTHDKRRAYVGLRSTLHALRDRLTVEEVAQFAAQLPMLIAAFTTKAGTRLANLFASDIESSSLPASRRSFEPRSQSILSSLLAPFLPCFPSE